MTVELLPIQAQIAARKLRTSTCRHFIPCGPLNPYRPERCERCRTWDVIERLLLAAGDPDGLAALDDLRSIFIEIADSEEQVA